ncbi:MAG: Adenine phosphoribosyltransferase [uncultured Thermomicrobiales bacterium]|uniref:Adenine phosphoribosyltransferase n=1 Tax=uncultured Thermomicrobiales bacterium TaxID=1645740 RepID=A0A6J4UU11_9BACT|nr:MAG: Adenine phosphoribosyltransferase [uncultured Thermomicrobiales bacterium]
MAILAEMIRDVPDFPQPGILFKDITTLLKDGAAFRQVLDELQACCRDFNVTKVVGMESRGFIFAAPLADRLGAGFVPARKLGRLPAETVRVEYALEYGTNTIEMHRDAIAPGERVLIVDDLLATGGTCRATISLVEELGGVVAGLAFLVELTFLNGRELLAGYDIRTLISY